MRALKVGFHLLLIIFALIMAPLAEARNRDQEFRRGRGGGWHGNERSERVARLNLGRAQAAGNGCPQGTMSVVFAPDNLSFSVLFDQFIAEAGGRQRRDNMSCTVTVPVEVPAGMQMEITRVDYRGFAGLPAQAHGLLQSVIAFRGPRGGDRDRLTLRYQFRGPLMDNYEISTDTLNDGPRDESELSPCGGDVQLRITSQLRLVTHAGEPASLTLDSIDGSANAIYYVNWRACRRGN